MEEKIHLPFTEVNFKTLLELVHQLKDEITFLKSEIDSLKSQQKTDSHNSSKPPSSDGLKKRNINLRTLSGKPIGGQIGHKGSTLKFEGVPDKIVYHIPFATCNCGNEYLRTEEKVSHEIDLPVIKKEVTAHKQIHYHCTKCGIIYSGKGVRGHPVQ